MTSPLDELKSIFLLCIIYSSWMCKLGFCFTSATILHGPSRWTYGVNTVHPVQAPLPGPPRFTTVVFDMSKTTGKTPGSSRSIMHRPGPSRWHTVQLPVLPGSPLSMDRGEPGSTGSQCRRLASTRRPKADWFANGPAALPSFQPGCPTT